MAVTKQTVTGRFHSDTKRMRKYTTEWGIIYVPLPVVEELGGPERVTFTIETVGDSGGQG